MKYWIRYSLLLAFICRLSIPAAAQQTHDLTLNDLFRLGTQNSLLLQAAQLQQEMTVTREKNAKTGRLPDILVGGTTGYIGQPAVFKQGLAHPDRPDMPDWSHNYKVEVTQPLYRGGRIRSTIKRATLEREKAALSRADEEAAVKIQLLRQYLDLFTLYKQREALARNIEESTRRLADIRRMRKEGLLTRNDEIRSELQLTNDQLARREADNNLTIVSQQLDVLLGLDETLLLRPDTALLSRPVPLQSCDYYIEEGYTRYPGLQMARTDTRLAQTDIRLAQADYLPALSLRAANTLARPLANTMDDLFSNNWNVALCLTYNLSSLYQNRHKVREARQYVNWQENRQEQIKQQIRIRVRSAYLRHKEAIDRVGALRLSVRQAEENYRIVQNRYLNQLSILTDLLDASSVRLEAEMQLTDARSEAVYTYYQLLRECGKLE